MSELPPGWAKTGLLSVCSARMGKTILSKDLVASGLPVYSAGVDDGPWGHTDDWSLSYPFGTLVVSARGTVGFVRQPKDTQFICTQTTIALSPNGSILPDYLKLFLTQVDWAAYTATTAIPMLTISAAEKIEMCVPPLAEQHHIVAKIDALTARSRRARAELAQVTRQINLFKSCLLKRVFADVQNLSPFFDKLDFKGGSQPPKSTFHKEPSAGRIRLLQIRDFASDEKAIYIDDNRPWPRCSKGDILVGRYGASVGKVLSGKSGAYNVALVKMLFSDAEVDRRFLFFWLRSDVFQGALSGVSRSAQDGFNKGDLESVLFPCPPLPEQRAIVARIETAFAALDRVEAEARAAERALDRLDQAILARAFRGELVPQDPADEPASVLLARIAADRASAPKAVRGRRRAVA